MSSSPASGITKMIVVKVYRYVILRVPKGTQELEIREKAIEIFNKIPNEEAMLIYDYVNEYESQSNEKDR